MKNFSYLTALARLATAERQGLITEASRRESEGLLEAAYAAPGEAALHLLQAAKRGPLGSRPAAEAAYQALSGEVA